MRSLGLPLLLAGCEPAAYVDLARAHAPVHYQDTDSSDPLSDELTAIDYDGNFVTTDNWDHLADPSTWTTGTHAVVYRSVVESCTHWFVTYAMYHPRDWSDLAPLPDQEHENDVEGLVLAVRKDGSPAGKVEAAITVFHLDFYSYVPAGSSWTEGEETVDGTLSFATVDGAPHPETAQEAKGHGLEARSYAGGFPGGDGITYLPGDVSEDPVDGNDRDVRYTLEDLLAGVWILQLTQSDPFVTWGKLAGDESGSCGDGGLLTCGEDSANLPWNWDDHDDVLEVRVIGGAEVVVSGIPAGLMALDPARLFDAYFDNVGDFSTDYLVNRYADDLRSAGWDDETTPDGFPPDLSLDELYTHLDATCP